MAANFLIFFLKDGITISRDFVEGDFSRVFGASATNVLNRPSSGGFQGFSKVLIQWESPKKSPGGNDCRAPT